MNHPQANQHISRRKALRLMLHGTVGGLLAQSVHTPAQAQTEQTVYLPTLPSASATSPEEAPLCIDEPDCEGEDCCIYTAAVDWGWFRTHLQDEILPKWLAAVTDQGLFLPHFDRQWRPLGQNFGTLVSQCRLIYNFAQGYALTRDPVYQEAVVKGTQFLLDHFRDQRHGGWYWSCNLDGAVRDRFKDSYGHAFVILGLAHAYQCTGDSALRAPMRQTWAVMDERLRDAQGGLHRRMTEDFQVINQAKEQNPLMHSFEALLAAGSVGGEPQMLQAARDVGNFVFDKLLRPGDRRLPELYDAQWQELPDTPDSGGELDIGHAFEWAYLSSRAAELGLPVRFLNRANSFLLYGMALGFDWKNGGVYSPVTPNGVIANREKGWWEQAEAIRALTHFYLRHKRNDLNGPLQRTLEFVKAAFIDPQYGGWYARLKPDNTPLVWEKGSIWKLDYHIVGMCMEAIRLTSQTAA